MINNYFNAYFRVEWGVYQGYELTDSWHRTQEALVSYACSPFFNLLTRSINAIGVRSIPTLHMILYVCRMVHHLNKSCLKGVLFECGYFFYKNIKITFEMPNLFCWQKNACIIIWTELVDPFSIVFHTPCHLPPSYNGHLGLSSIYHTPGLFLNGPRVPCCVRIWNKSNQTSLTHFMFILNIQFIFKLEL